MHKIKSENEQRILLEHKEDIWMLESDMLDILDVLDLFFYQRNPPFSKMFL